MNGDKIIQISKNVEQETADKLCFSGVFSVKDLKSNIFGALLVVENQEEAIRACKVRLMYDTQSLMCQFPEDFMLYNVGYFNTKTGVLESTGVPVPVISIFDISEQLRKERHSKPVDVPKFEEGDKNECGHKDECASDVAENS